MGPPPGARTPNEPPHQGAQHTTPLRPSGLPGKHAGRGYSTLEVATKTGVHHKTVNDWMHCGLDPSFAPARGSGTACDWSERDLLAVHALARIVASHRVSDGIAAARHVQTHPTDPTGDWLVIHDHRPAIVTADRLENAIAEWTAGTRRAPITFLKLTSP
jgi:hypothetical protein